MKEAKYYRNLKNTKVYCNSILDTFDTILDREVRNHASNPFMHGPVIYHKYLKDIETPDGSIKHLISTYGIVLYDIANMLKNKLIDLGYSNIRIEIKEDELDDEMSIRIEFNY